MAKQVAEIHEYTVKQINQLVYKNLDWFDEGIDYLDLKSINSSTYPGVISNYPSAEPAISTVDSKVKKNFQAQVIAKKEEAEKFWWSGKLAELILSEIKQNREELNNLHLEVRDLKEEVKELKKLSQANQTYPQLNIPNSSQNRKVLPLRLK